jgi:hypothetical protein
MCGESEVTQGFLGNLLRAGFALSFPLMAVAGQTKILRAREAVMIAWYFARRTRRSRAFCTWCMHAPPRKCLKIAYRWVWHSHCDTPSTLSILATQEIHMQLSSQITRDRHLVRSINVREIDQLDQWCRAFGVTRNQLTAAVSTVGANPDLVRRYLHLQNAVPC